MYIQDKKIEKDSNKTKLSTNRSKTSEYTQKLNIQSEQSNKISIMSSMNVNKETNRERITKKKNVIYFMLNVVR